MQALAGTCRLTSGICESDSVEYLVQNTAEQACMVLRRRTVESVGYLHVSGRAGASLDPVCLVHLAR